MVLSGVVSWGIGRILDVVLKCDRCGERMNSRVGNRQINTLACKNCWHEVIQFTNACDYTVSPDGYVGHVSGKLLGGFSVGEDPANRGFVAKKYPDWIFSYTAFRARDMLGKQFVVVGKITDYSSGTVYAKNEVIYTPSYQDSRWYDNSCIALRWKDIPLGQSLHTAAGNSVWPM